FLCYNHSYRITCKNSCKDNLTDIILLVTYLLLIIFTESLQIFLQDCIDRYKFMCYNHSYRITCKNSCKDFNLLNITYLYHSLSYSVYYNLEYILDNMSH